MSKRKKAEVQNTEVAPVKIEQISVEDASVLCPEDKGEECCGTPDSCVFQVAEVPVVEAAVSSTHSYVCNVSVSKVTVRLADGDLRLASKQCEKVLTKSLTDAARLLEASGRIVIQNL